MPVSRETAKRPTNLTAPQIAKIEEFVSLLDRWRHVTDLISRQGFKSVWERHVEDSLFLYEVSPKAARWLDIGSGAGFPAVILAIMLADRGDAEVHCVESDGRKCAFLRAVAESLSVPLKVHNLRAEHLSESGIADIEAVTARAFSGVEKILGFASSYMRRGAIAVLPRGKTYQFDIEQIDASRYDLDIIRSSSPNGGAVFLIADKVRGP